DDKQKRLMLALPGRRLVLFLAVASLFLAGFGTYALLNSPYFSVRTVRVSNTHNLDAAGVANLSGLEGASIFSLPLDRARQRLLSVPEIKDVSFTRRWPSTVVIEVEERAPFAFWSVNGRDYVV